MLRPSILRQPLHATVSQPQTQRCFCSTRKHLATSSHPKRRRIRRGYFTKRLPPPPPPSRLLPPSDNPPTSALRPFLQPATWSSAALHSSSSHDTDSSPEAAQAHLTHLLRLSALPTTLPDERRNSLLHSIQSQMSFVHDIQSVDTRGVEPLRAIADETDEGMRERTIGMAELREALDQEVVFGFRRRPRRIRSGESVEAGEDGIDGTQAGKGLTPAGGEIDGEWDPLTTATQRGGPGKRYFIVESKSRME